ncbi:group III truncated hemoglobin [Tenacibaculum sp. IB213877]|uniref:group III truncated hemoglobin n=1 Tax=Tenacibaculum sp. IB213877 TaxID=3097351 RepID=UPI002A59D680|nr:group III truncated hemoglobin [Tenacibaculum sp. IB213877]MDY0781382.1 group III truncated hemoglobin [Tenacibaculum sp. IB213877]
MKPDITSREDIKLIIIKFYDSLLSHEKMFPFFEEIVNQNELEHHLEIIIDFWEDLLFNTYKYKNNPMQKHLDFAKRIPFTKEHFNLWLYQLTQTIDFYFEGENCSTMKTRANSIATIMQIKMKLFDT